MEKRVQKELLTTTAADRVSSLDYRYERLAVVQNVLAIKYSALSKKRL